VNEREERVARECVRDGRKAQELISSRRVSVRLTPSRHLALSPCPLRLHDGVEGGRALCTRAHIYARRLSSSRCVGLSWATWVKTHRAVCACHRWRWNQHALPAWRTRRD
jgi:hypothetical protein